MGKDFAHLHLHTTYSMSDGCIKPKELMKYMKENGMSTCAITDHGTGAGILKFYKEGLKNGIKVIPGCEFYVVPSIQKIRQLKKDKVSLKDKEHYHLVLLAMNEDGYKNLTTLISLSNQEGVFSLGGFPKPHIDHKLLKEYNKGLIALSACIQGEIPRSITNSSSSSRLTLERYLGIFGDRLYLEIQKHGMNNENLPAQSVVNSGIKELCDLYSIKPVLTCDAHYLTFRDKEVQNIVRAIGYKAKTLEALKYKALPDTWVKTPNDIYSELRTDFEIQAAQNTRAIADRCNVKIDTESILMPEIKPKIDREYDVLRHHIWDGLNKRFEGEPPKEYIDRISHELYIVDKMGFCQYFLILEDIVEYARGVDIFMSPGRGSASGSLISYSLGITDIDPIKHGLYFERFLNIGRMGSPDIKFDVEIKTLKATSKNQFDSYFDEESIKRLSKREKQILQYEMEDLDANQKAYLVNVAELKASLLKNTCNSMVAYAMGIATKPTDRVNRTFHNLCDIDMDFAHSRRNEIFRYCAEKYGWENVASIATDHTWKAKSAIRDVARLKEYNPSEIDAFIKEFIPDEKRGGQGKHAVTIEKILEIDKVKRELENNQSIAEVLYLAKQIEGLTRHRSEHACGFVISNNKLASFCPMTKSESLDGMLMTEFDKDDVEAIGLVKFDFLGINTLTIVDMTEKLIQEHNKEFCIKNISVDNTDFYSHLSEMGYTGLFQIGGDGISKYVEQIQPDRFEDIVAAVALYRPGPIDAGIADSYVKRKHGKEEFTYVNGEMKNILGKTYGLMVYQEQIMEITKVIAGYSLQEADIIRKAIGKKDPKLMASMKESFISGCIKHSNWGKDSAGKLWGDIEGNADYNFNLSHSASYSKLTHITAYLKYHYPLEFAAASLSVISDEKKKGWTEEVNSWISELKGKGKDIFPFNINKSTSSFAVEEDGVRFGFKAINNLSKNLVEHIEKVQPFDNIDDFISKTRELAGLSDYVTLINVGSLDCFGRRLWASHYIKNKVRLLNRAQKNKNQMTLFKSTEGVFVPRVQLSKDQELTKQYKALGYYISEKPTDIYSHLIELDDDERFGVITNLEFKISKKKGTEFCLLTLNTDKKDEVIVVWTNLLMQIRDKLAEGKPVVIRVNNNFAQSIDTAGEFISSRMKGVRVSIDNSRQAYKLLKNMTNIISERGNTKVIFNLTGSEIHLGYTREITSLITLADSFGGKVEIAL